MANAGQAAPAPPPRPAPYLRGHQAGRVVGGGVLHDRLLLGGLLHRLRLCRQSTASVPRTGRQAKDTAAPRGSQVSLGRRGRRRAQTVREEAEYAPRALLRLLASRPAPTTSSSEMSRSCQQTEAPQPRRRCTRLAQGCAGPAPTFTPLSFRRGVLDGGMGVRFPAGLKTLGAVGLLKGACFGMPLSGAVGGAAVRGHWCCLASPHSPLHALRVLGLLKGRGHADPRPGPQLLPAAPQAPSQLEAQPPCLSQGPTGETRCLPQAPIPSTRPSPAPVSRHQRSWVLSRPAGQWGDPEPPVEIRPGWGWRGGRGNCQRTGCGGRNVVERGLSST